MLDLQYRQVLPQDVSALVEICEGHLSPEFNWTLSKLSEELAQGSGFVAIDRGQIISFVLFRSSADVAEITVLASRAGRLRRGGMRELLKFSIDKLAAAQSHGRIWLEVHAANKAAVDLYESLNFKEVGRRPRYYPDGGDAILLERFL